MFLIEGHLLNATNLVNAFTNFGKYIFCIAVLDDSALFSELSLLGLGSPSVMQTWLTSL